MNKRKALSLLLATAMVFTMNTVSFAAETTNETQSPNEQTVETQVVYKDQTEKDKALGQSDNGYKKTQTENYKVNLEANKMGIDFDGLTYEVDATGKKVKSSAITGTKKTGYDIIVSANGYRTSVKKVKITSNAKDCGSEVTYKISKLNGAKYVEKYDVTTGNFVSLQSKEAKEGLKAIKSSLSTIKGFEFKAVIVPQELDGAVSMNFIKSLGKTVSAGAVHAMNDAKIDLRNKIVVTTKNGAVKKVQVLDQKWLKSTQVNHGDSYRGAFAKLTFRTLKKNKDYTLSGNTVIVDNSNVYYVMKNKIDDGSFTANW